LTATKPKTHEAYQDKVTSFKHCDASHIVQKQITEKVPQKRFTLKQDNKTAPALAKKKKPQSHMDCHLCAVIHITFHVAVKVSANLR